MSDKQPEVIEITREEVEEKTKQPPMYRVILHNDDYTTREFVVEILVYVFHKPVPEATELMWRVHRRGRGVAGVYPRDVAETKMVTVVQMARDAEYPLKVTMEPD